MEGLAELKAAFPDLCVAMFSGLDDRELVFEALRLGAMGFIVKRVLRQAFIKALRDVLSGKVYLPASVVGPQPTVLPTPIGGAGVRPVSDTVSLGLTPREFEVLGGVALGKSNPAFPGILLPLPSMRWSLSTIMCCWASASIIQAKVCGPYRAVFLKNANPCYKARSASCRKKPA